MQCTRLLQSVPRQRSVLRGYSATPHLLAKIRSKQQVKPKVKGKSKLPKVKLAATPPLPKGPKLTKEQRKEEEALLKKVLEREAEGPYLSLEDQDMFVPSLRAQLTRVALCKIYKKRWTSLMMHQVLRPT